MGDQLKKILFELIQVKHRKEAPHSAFDAQIA